MEMLRQGLDLCLKRLELVGQPSGSTVSLADFASQLERGLASPPRQPEKPVQFTTEGGIAPAKAAGPVDVFGSVAPVSRSRPEHRPGPSSRSGYDNGGRSKKQSQQIVAQMQEEDRRRRAEQDRQEQARRQEEIGRASFDECGPGALPIHRTAVRKAYLSRRTPEQLDSTEGKWAAQPRNAGR